MMRIMKEQLKVEVISSETIKPSSPTLPHSKSFTLSFLDQAFLSWHTSFALVYSNNSNSNNKVDIIGSLKASLSETLTVFYPLAGRFENESTISCDDQGALFIETQFNCLLSTILTLPDHNVLSMLEKCLPPIDVYGAGRPITEVIPLAFQVNVFTCGSIVIGCYMIHKLLDAASMSTFLNYWAALSSTKCSSDNEMLVVKQQPDFDSTVATFPPAPRDFFSKTSTTMSIKSDIDYKNLPQVVGKSFVFNKVAIEKLKVKASSEELPNPTGFEAVSAFIWQRALTAAATSSKKIDVSILVFPANIRPRTCPPLPKGAMGNLITEVCTTAQVNIDELSQLATKINAAKVATVNKKVELLQRLGAEAMLLETHKGFDLEMGTYHLTSWCKLGLSDVDFGFGKPNRIFPVVLVNPFLRNRFCLVDYVDMTTFSEIEAWLFLEEKEMQLLRSDSCFLEFACPT